MNDELRAKLLSIAARRGIKGFSKIVEEALESYLELELSKNERIEKALAAKGSLDEDDAERLLDVSAELRKSWR